MAKAKTKVSKKKAKTPAKKKVAKTSAKKKVVKKKPAQAKTVSKKKPAAKKKPASTIKKKAKIATKKKATSAKTKPVAKKNVAKKSAAKKKAVAKKAVAKKAVAKKAVTKKTTASKKVDKPKAVVSKPKAKAAASAPPAPRIIRKINLEDVKIADDFKPSSKEEYMGPEHLAYFKRKLENWRDELIIESQETLEHLRTETRDVGDEAERASRESDNILELRTRDRYRKLLRKIEEALKRIEDGAYGFCEETGEEIGLGRLEARPIATLTVDAQERREMFQKQFRDDR